MKIKVGWRAMRNNRVDLLSVKMYVLGMGKTNSVTREYEHTNKNSDKKCRGVKNHKNS